MGEKVVPHLHQVITPDAHVFRNGYALNGHHDDVATIVDSKLPIETLALDHAIPWALTALDAYNAPSNDKGIKTMARAMGQYAAEKTGETHPQVLKTYESVYQKLNTHLKKEGVQVEPAYAQAVYLEIVPELLHMNGVTDTLYAGSGYNSIDQVVSVATAIMKAPTVKDNGSTVRIYSQMCAQYASGETHSQESFSRGLVDNFDEEKVKRTFDPINKILDVFERFEIPVEVITPQVAADPELMLAMVPATVWTYVEQGKVAEMLMTLDRHAKQLPQVIGDALHTEDRQFTTHEAPSLADLHAGETSIIENTLYYSGLFGQVHDMVTRKGQEATTSLTDAANKWFRLDIKDVRSIIREIDNNDQFFPHLLKTMREDYGWQDKDVSTFQTMLYSLAQEKWGAVDDTEKFYKRESVRRTETTAKNWRRDVNYDTEVTKLLETPEFHPDYSEEERTEAATALVQWVDAIANIGIGGRAVFNVALYTSLGEHIAKLQKNGNVAIMWPVEEDVDSWAVKAMNDAFKTNSEQSYPTIPCVYPRKELRQPFGR